MNEQRPRASMRTVMASGGFRRLLAAQTISRWGDTFNAVALVILVFELTGSGVRVAGTVAFEIARCCCSDSPPARSLIICRADS